MKRLQELIIGLGEISVEQINRAIFSYPEVGLLESISREFGEAKEQSLLNAVAEQLRIPLLSPNELRIAEELFQDHAVDVGLLFEKHKALPVYRLGADGTSHIMLAMVDPLDHEGLASYSRLFGQSFAKAMIRERDLQLTFAGNAAALALQAREELQRKRETSLERVSKYGEDPEIRKAIQQITATAVKHGADSVLIPLSAAYTRAEFRFRNGPSSAVEISVSPSALLASLLRRGQVVERRTSQEFVVATRVEFKASSVDFFLHYCRERQDEGGAGQGKPRGAFLKLSGFAIDRLDNPLFWRGLAEEQSRKLKRIFKAKAGLFVVSSADSDARSQALRALTQSYSDVYGKDAAEQALNDPLWLEHAKNYRVLVGLNAPTLASALERLTLLTPEERSLLKGILIYYEVPAVCPCCSTEHQVGAEELAAIPAFLSYPFSKVHVGKGCAVCEGSGYLGAVGVNEILELQGEVGRRFLQGGSINEILSALFDDGFVSLLEDGLQQVALGRCNLTTMLQTLPEPDEAYLYAYQQRAEAHAAESDEDNSALPDPESIEFSDARLETNPAANGTSANSSFAPFTGAAAFVVGMRDARPLETSDTTLEAASPESSPGLIDPDASDPSERADDAPALLLVIDDDPDQRAILRRILELEGYEVETASDGVDGIVSANRLQPALIIVDFMMPDLDGRETIQRLKSQPQTAAIPVVALTAYAGPDVEYGLLKAGADDFCAKSVPKKILLQRIERLV